MRTSATTTQADENVPRLVPPGVGKLELLVGMRTVVLDSYQAALAQLFDHRGGIGRFAAIGIEENVEPLRIKELRPPLMLSVGRQNHRLRAR